LFEGLLKENLQMVQENHVVYLSRYDLFEQRAYLERSSPSG
jgi:hypothetical protein